MIKSYMRAIIKKLGLTSRPHPFFFSNLLHIGSFFKSVKRDSSLAQGDVVCLIATWDERLMIRYALESSKDFVYRYVVIDKDGSTVPYIEECQDRWDLDIEIHIKPKLNLRDSWAFGIKRIDEPWILIQDGDEVFHTDGPRSIQSLKHFMDRPNVVYCTPMVLLMGDLHHTHQRYPIMPPHPFLYHNNGTLRAPSLKSDHPVMDGWKIGLPEPYKFNCRIKPRVRAGLLGRKLPIFNIQKYGPYPKVIRHLVEKNTNFF